MSSTTRRILLYAAGAIVAAVALFAGWGYEPPPDAAVRLNGAAMIGGLGQYDEAIAICDQVLREHPDNLEARIYRATFLAAAKRHEESLAAYDEALAHAGEEEMKRNLIQDRAGVLLTLGRLDEFAAARRTLAAAGDDYRVHVLDGLAAERAGDLADAVGAYEQGLAAKPDDEHLRARLWHALVRRGDAAVAARDFETARTAYDRACPLFENAYMAHLKAAEVRIAAGAAGAAADVLAAVEPATPGLAPLAFRTATALLERGRVEGALRALSLAVRADRAAVRALLGKTNTWEALRGDARVLALLEEPAGAGAGASMRDTDG